MKTYTIIAGMIATALVVVFWVVNVRTATAPSPTVATTTTSSTSQTVTPAIGASTTINGTTITVRSLVEDSRCPVDVQCIQAGTVRVLVSVNTSSNELTLTLGQPQTVGNEVITLASVIPAQKYAKQTVELSDYRFTFTVVPKVTTTGDGWKACTMDAKLCPDGSAVGRTGPNCEFTPCPSEASCEGGPCPTGE